MIEHSDCQVSEIAHNTFDLEGKVIRTISAGHIGYCVFQCLVPFDCKELLYYDYNSLLEGLALLYLNYPFLTNCVGMAKMAQCSSSRDP